jgi:maltose O-acetyltransferase
VQDKADITRGDNPAHMKLPLGTFAYSLKAFLALRRRWRLWYFSKIDGLTHREIRVGRNARFHVPVRSNGRGRIVIGDDNVFGFPLSHRLGNGEILLQARTSEAEILIGRNNIINNNSAIYCIQRVVIGDDCLVGDSVTIYDSDFHNLQPEARKAPQLLSSPVVIGNNVWIGSRAMILKGVTIGDGSVIGAMSIVTRPVPPRRVAVGNPAKIIRELP